MSETNHSDLVAPQDTEELDFPSGDQATVRRFDRSAEIAALPVSDGLKSLLNATSFVVTLKAAI